MSDLKLIFIDIDGVLNNMVDETSYFTYDPHKYGLSDANIGILKHILAETGAKLVLSTSWRNHDDDFAYPWRDLRFKSPLRKFMQEMGNDAFFEIKSAPHLDGATKAQDIIGFFYILKDQFGLDMSEVRFAVIDDQTNQDLQRFTHNFFLTDKEVGLTWNDAVSIIHHLTKEFNNCN